MSITSIPYQGLDVPIAQVHGDQYFADNGEVFVKCSTGWRILFPNKFIIMNAQAVKISMTPSGIWRDRFGTMYGIRDTGAWADLDPACGVWPLELSVDSPLTDACKLHDYQFQSPLFQLFHTESEANKQLAENLKKVGASKFIYKLFYGIVDQLGQWWWENPKTKNK